jgi:transcription termination factor 2
MMKLYEHQRIALPLLKNMEENGKGGFLADQMGLGKTKLMSTYLKDNKINRKTDLIVCPVSLLKQWEREIKTVYSEDEQPEIFIYHGKARVRNLRNSGRIDYILTTYSILGTGELNRHRWGRVVLDESHTIKNGLRHNAPKCAVSAYIIASHSQYNWCISGTPFNNRMKDIASQCKFIGTRPYNDPKWWKSKNGGLDENEVKKWRDQYVLRRTKDNILKLPQYFDIEVEPTINEKVLVNRLREEAQKKFNMWKISQGLTKIKLQGQILALIQRLRVISNSYYCGENNIIAEEVMKNNAKVYRMVDDLKSKIYDDPAYGVVIFSQFTSYLDVLNDVIQDEIPEVDILKFNGSMSSEERDKVVTEFTTSKIPRVLLISLMAGGVGLNLMPCATVFMSEPYFNPFIETQAEERVHRLGQISQVKIYRYTMENSVETWINGLKKKKFFLAGNLDMVSKRNRVKEFSMDELSKLFTDLVGFEKETSRDKRIREQAEKDIAERENDRKITIQNIERAKRAQRFSNMRTKH